MPIFELLSPLALHIALIIVLVIAAIALLAFLNSRWLIADFYTTYAIRVHEGIRRFPASITWLRTLSFYKYEYIVRGSRNAARFEFLTRNRNAEGGWIVKTLYLMNRKTGAIDLRVHTMEVRPFKVSSADHHDMEVSATIEFQLDRGRLFRCFQYANLGVALLTRFEGFIRAQINSRQNQDVAKDIAKIREAILQDMKKAEDRDNELLKAWGEQNGKGVLPNGYFKGTQSTALGIHVTGLSLQVEQVDAPEELSAQTAGQHSSALMIPPKRLDDLRDMFERGGADIAGANEALLRTMEMHTRENIARLASNAGRMIIISSEDLGVARTSVFRSSIRAEEAAQAEDSSTPQGGEPAKERDEPAPESPG
jgi:hypothetical protein